MYEQEGSSLVVRRAWVCIELLSKETAKSAVTEMGAGETKDGKSNKLENTTDIPHDLTVKPEHK